MPRDHADTSRIVEFLRSVGIAVVAGTVEDSFLPGITVRDGGIIYDPDRLTWPGDLLHEAGHIAVTDPALRPTLDVIAIDQGDEMATIAWSYAAAVAAGVDPVIVLHAGGYGEGGEWMATAFADGAMIGQPMLQYYGMTSGVTAATTDPGAPVYPAMIRWLR